MDSRHAPALSAPSGRETSDPQPMRGKIIVITGATDGIGRVAAQNLATAGAQVVLVGRNAAKTEAAANAIMNSTGRRDVLWDTADLKEMQSVRELAARVDDRLQKIDVLINNAGAIFARREVTADGLERTFALNHLAYFSLTLLLLHKLYAAATPRDPARIIIVSSRAHTSARLDLDDLQSTRSFGAWRAYQNSKLENLLFMRALVARLDASRVIAHALHPGVVATRFATSGNARWGRFMRWAMNLRSITPAEGADTMTWLAMNAEAAKTSGDYWIKRVRRAPSAAALNASDAERLWIESAKLTGIDANAITERNRA